MTLTSWRIANKGVLAAPDRFALYSKLASTLRGIGEANAADSAIRKAVSIRPGEARIHVNAANLWLTTKLAGNPERALRRSQCLDPSLCDALSRLVIVHKAKGEEVAAKRMSQRAICLTVRPSEPKDSTIEQAALLAEAGNVLGAMKRLRSGIAVLGAEADWIGRVLGCARRIGGSNTSASLARAVLCLRPVDPVASRELAVAAGREDVDRSEASTVERLRLALPDVPLVWNGAGVLLDRRGSDKAAERCFMSSILLDPAMSAAVFNLGALFRNSGRFALALRQFWRTRVLEPGEAIFAYNHGHALLAAGDRRLGLELYESRWESGERASFRRGGRNPSFKQPILEDPTNLGPEKTVLVWGEQGLGDEIWFAGYVPQVLGYRKTTMECDPRLVDLFRRSELAGEVVARQDPAATATARASFQVAAGSLPLLAERANARQRARLRPSPTRYLVPDPSRVEAFREKLSGLGEGPVIGLSWRSHKPRRGRSFAAPIVSLSPILRLPGVRFVTLQYGDVRHELEAARREFGVQILNFEDFDPFLDIDTLTALCASLDHVVSVANVTVSICHGLGKPCDVALKNYQEDWRFQRDSGSSPWLPSCRLYWPRSGNSWSDVFVDIAAHLSRTWGIVGGP